MSKKSEIKAGKERAAKLTTTYQLGIFVGLYCNTELPFISLFENENAPNAIYPTKLEIKNFHELANSHSEEISSDVKEMKERLVYDYINVLRTKYLPETYKCYLHLINVDDEDEFKRGLQYAFDYSCDGVCYSGKPDDIELTHDYAFGESQITFKREFFAG